MLTSPVSPVTPLILRAFAPAASLAAGPPSGWRATGGRRGHLPGLALASSGVTAEHLDAVLIGLSLDVGPTPRGINCHLCSISFQPARSTHEPAMPHHSDDHHHYSGGRSIHEVSASHRFEHHHCGIRANPRRYDRSRGGAHPRWPRTLLRACLFPRSQSQRAGHLRRVAR